MSNEHAQHLNTFSGNVFDVWKPTMLLAETSKPYPHNRIAYTRLECLHINEYTQDLNAFHFKFVDHEREKPNSFPKKTNFDFKIMLKHKHLLLRCKHL